MKGRFGFLCCLLAMAALAMSAAGCTLVEIYMGPKLAPLEERTLAGSGRDKVLLIEVSGVMFESRDRSLGTPFSPRENVLARLREELDQARRDPGIKALLIKINSPGGSVTAADIMYHQIERFCRETGVKSVACLMGVAASGGYYVALAGDRILALPTTVTGSIGVISLRLDLAELLARYGVRTDAVKSAPLKDMWSPFRPASEEERRIMRGLVEELFLRFKGKVRARRPGMSAGQLEEAASARIFTASQALALGLIDGLAYPDEAFEAAVNLAGLKEARLVAYHRPGGYRPNVYARGLSTSELDMSDWLGLSGGAPVHVPLAARLALDGGRERIFRRTGRSRILMEIALAKLQCILEVLDGLREGLSHFSQPSRAARRLRLSAGRTLVRHGPPGPAAGPRTQTQGAVPGFR